MAIPKLVSLLNPSNYVQLTDQKEEGGPHFYRSGPPPPRRRQSVSTTQRLNYGYGASATSPSPIEGGENWTGGLQRAKLIPMMEYWNNGKSREESHRRCGMSIAHRLTRLCLVIATCATLLSLSSTTSCGEQKIFATWEGFEADKLASIWLIKRFIVPGASILIVPKGRVVTGAIQFDTPTAEITRKFNKSTFESFLDYYRIKDKKLINIGKLIHDIEINIWEKKLFKRTREVQIRTLEIMEKYRNNEEIIDKACEFFERLYETLPAELEPN
jgi:hypothetical protein